MSQESSAKDSVCPANSVAARSSSPTNSSIPSLLLLANASCEELTASSSSLVGSPSPKPPPILPPVRDMLVPQSDPFVSPRIQQAPPPLKTSHDEFLFGAPSSSCPYLPSLWAPPAQSEFSFNGRSVSYTSLSKKEETASSLLGLQTRSLSSTLLPPPSSTSSLKRSYDTSFNFSTPGTGSNSCSSLSHLLCPSSPPPLSSTSSLPASPLPSSAPSKADGAESKRKTKKRKITPAKDSTNKKPASSSSAPLPVVPELKSTISTMLQDLHSRTPTGLKQQIQSHRTVYYSQQQNIKELAQQLISQHLKHST